VDADKIWDALMGFARYGFNRAHTADYAVIVAQTGYLKAHYPAEYMAALLTVERHNTEKVGLLIAECRRMGIEVLPPSVNFSANGFTIEQLPATHPAPRQLTAFPFPVVEGAAIRMGLDAIKNVGEGPVELILRSRGNRPFVSLADFAERVDLRQVNRRGLECLIKVGALDEFGERGQLLAAMDRILGASLQVHEAAEVGQMALFSGGSEDGGDLLAALPRSARFRQGDWTDTDGPETQVGQGPEAAARRKEMLEWEKELVGVYVSSHPLQQMTADMVNVVTHGTTEITEELNGALVVLAGMISDVRVITTKKGDVMAFVRLEDLQGSTDVTVFPQLYRHQRELWALDKIVIVRGKVDARNGRVSVVADSVQNYVEGVRLIEDVSSVAYRYRNGAGQQKPNVARRPSSVAQEDLPQRLSPGLQDRAGSAYGMPPGLGDEDEPYFEEPNPFADEEPEWRYEVRPVPAAQAQGGFANSPDAPMQSVREAKLEPAEPDTAAGVSPPEPAPAEPVAAVAESAGSGNRTARIVFRRSRSLDADRRRLFDLVQILSGFEGQDRFEIVVEANGAVRYQLDFPNNRTRICRELRSMLDQRVGPGAWTVEDPRKGVEE
jgi:DNA polymerase-3 subunit alpha